MHRRILFFIIMLLTALPALGCEPRPDVPPQPLAWFTAEAEPLIAERRFSEAVEVLEAAAQTLPDEPTPLVQMGQIYPDIVGVEVSVALDILKSLNFLFRALGDFPQDEVALDMTGDVAAFAVGRCALSHLHHKGKIIGSKEPQKGWLQGCPEVVGIGNKCVCYTLLQ